MKRFIMVGLVLFFIQTSLLTADIANDFYSIRVTTVGDEALVDAIKKYSDITEADVNRWSYAWTPLGNVIKNKMINKVKEFLKTYQGFTQINLNNYKDIQICKVLKNLAKQAEAARALLNRFGTDVEIKLYDKQLDFFIGDIKSKNNYMAGICSGIDQTKATKTQKQLQAQKDQLEINKLWWRTNELRWKMVKDISWQMFQGAKWIAQTVRENQGTSLLSTVAAWYVYNKLFGIKQ